MEQLWLEWGTALLGSGCIGAFISYLFNWKNKRKLANAEAECAVLDAEHKKLTLNLDLYDYVQNKFDNLLKDYHNLAEKFRKEISEQQIRLNRLIIANSKAISEKCNEIAALKSEITYLKGIRCYNFTCPNRVFHNPDKKK